MVGAHSSVDIYAVSRSEYTHVLSFGASTLLKAFSINRLSNKEETGKLMRRTDGDYATTNKFREPILSEMKHISKHVTKRSFAV